MASHLDVKFSFYLFGLPKPVRSQRELSVNTITESFTVFSLAFREFQSVERRLERLFGAYHDEGASSSGIRARLVLGIVTR
ncbi:hypothetical protein DEO72_LG4g440 [Vigna unguiculata]|uniref:Uncharacterized protein n=1 Tax=Vigna unguiculata TaxID=3917 RepID=A0A4D6LMD3_VIGUN|nr:hypothetical protein DEO72_LG4g440 [Vigna unguiculata]